MGDGLHKLVLGMVGMFLLFASTLPLAMARVGATPKFGGQPLVSLDCRGGAPRERTPWEFFDCLGIDAVAELSGKPGMPARLSSPLADGALAGVPGRAP